MSDTVILRDNVKVVCEYDTVVVGGGIAGISAALAAARSGAKVLLAERQFALGGLATLGLVTIYLPLCDGKGHQVSFGISEELLRLSAKHGCEINTPWLTGGSLEDKIKTRFRVQYNASIFAILCEQLLVSEGVKILYGSQLSDTVVRDSKITELIFQNKEGRQAVRCGSVVDCSGDADVCYFSGENTRLFNQKNILAAWYYHCDSDGFKLNSLGVADIPDKHKTAEQRSLTQKRYVGLTSEEISEFCIDSHSSLIKDFLKGGELSDSHSLASIASIPQLRMTRCLCGKMELDDSSVHTRFETSVGMFSDWRKSGPVYELPFETLFGNKIKNLITAGRCISVTDAMWDITRVIPVCAVSGQAAGVAAATCSDFSKADVSSLQKRLTSQGVRLHQTDL